MTGLVKRLSEWPHTVRARYALRASHPFAAAMVLLAPRRTTLHLSRPQIVHVSLHLGAAAPSNAQTTFVHTTTSASGLREIVRESTRISDAPRLLPNSLTSTSRATAQREIVPEAGSHGSIHETAPQPDTTSTSIRNITLIHGIERRHRRIMLTTEIAHTLHRRLLDSSVRVEKPVNDALRMVEALPHRTTAAAAATVDQEHPAERSKRPSLLAAQPEFDLDSVTTQVIQQLDHRLIAYRERMGRL
jgi:hypothetical protein